MAIVPGEVVNLSDDDRFAFIAARGKHQLPTAFVQVKAKLGRFVDEFGSNHISGVAGHWVHDLTDLCKMTNVEPVVMDENF
jgi:L-fucose isomerase